MGDWLNSHNSQREEQLIDAGDSGDTMNGNPMMNDSVESDSETPRYNNLRQKLRSRLYQIGDKLEFFRNDPNDPLYSAKSFEELNIPPMLLKGMYDMNFKKPSRIQEVALPVILDDLKRNLIAQSQSGTGKTAAFSVGALYRVDPTLAQPQVIILSPTYELSIQTSEVVRQLGAYMKDVTVRHVIRGERILGKIREHILIGTPGKMIDWALKCKYFDISTVKLFILDEADIMIDMQGLRAQSIIIRNALSPECQMMLFSATYTDEVMHFAKRVMPEKVLIFRLSREEQTLENINQYYINVRNENDKYEALTNLFGTISMGQAFIFVETKASAAELARRLRADSHQVALISGDLSTEERNEAFRSFRETNERVIIATNVMARGIDISSVTVVINYDLPIQHETREVDYETYLHRIGRTGRFGREGLAINFVDGPRTMQMIRDLEKYFGRPIHKLDASDVDEIEKLNY